MDEREAAIAERVRQAVNSYQNNTERSQQTTLGISALGFCQERTRRELTGQEPSDPTDWNKAFVGTAVGDYLEQAQARFLWPNALYQSEVIITLDGATRSYTLPGHTDILIPPCEDFPGGACIDNKTKGELIWVQRETEPSRNYQWQRNLYAIAAHRMGLLGDGPLEEVEVGNIYYDRSGNQAVPHVQIEKVNTDVLFEATEWLDDVSYAIQTGEEARKEPPREMCAVACGFFTVCRAFDTDVEGLIDHPETVGAIEAYFEGAALEKEGKKLKQAASLKLNGVEGNTADASVRWSHINGGPVSYQRESYLRLSVTRRKLPNK